MLNHNLIGNKFYVAHKHVKAMMGLLTAGGSAAAAIVYLAHKGHASVNWVAIFQQFSNICERISGSLIGSFGAIIVFMVLILLSASRT